jgi:hypothetical protein
MNGIDIIAQHQLRNTILVTSHYADKEVVARASELGIPILPKRLSSKLPIRVQSAEGRVQ